MLEIVCNGLLTYFTILRETFYEVHEEHFWRRNCPVIKSKALNQSPAMTKHLEMSSVKLSAAL